MFLGSFNKAYNHRDCEYLKSECGIEYDFDAELYNKVEKEIKTVLGDKGKYTGKEAFLFFQQKYSAVAIDLRYYYNYLESMDIGFGLFDAFTVSNTEDIESLSEACGQFYPYLQNVENEKEKEQCLTFVIDITGNPFLRKEYPQIIEFEQKNLQRAKRHGNVCKEKGGYCLYQDGRKVNVVINKNIIITMGSLDGVSINSIKIVSGQGVFPEIDYMLEFFRRYS